NLFWTSVLSIVIGLILSSAFSAILVYAQELLPGKVGMIAGLFFGFAFGMGGLGAALLGQLADAKGIEFVYQICAYLPAIGLLAVFLPGLRRRGAAAHVAHRQCVSIGRLVPDIDHERVLRGIGEARDGDSAVF